MAASLSRHAPPKASAMIESLRGLGYTTATALADIIDNSIAANANRVDINFIWQGTESIISILDNGIGMTEGELDKGMRLGEINPLDSRKINDLGRFGLGLKTASFSQCRRLTVASRKNKVVNSLRWDLDVIATSKDDGWYLLEGVHNGSEGLLSPLNSYDTGCLVLWEVMDRIITPGFSEQDFLDLIDRIEQHIAMVFHRLLESSVSKLKIYINNKAVCPWNPFLMGHPGKPWNSPEVHFPSAYEIVMECHVLPHKDGLTDSEFQSAGGPEGWTAQQGFYVYRNKRLLIAGTWLGLGQGRAWIKDEAHRLARIRLDIPNSADAEWKIDIRKSVARPPVNLRPWLARYAEDTRTRARRVFAHRGKPSTGIKGQPVVAAWKTEHFTGGIRYRIDPDHPAIRSVLEDAGILLPQIKAMFRVIEETIPVQRIWIDTAENRETPRTNFNGEMPDEVIQILNIMYRNLVLRKGVLPARAREQLLGCEPFHNYPDLISALPDHLPQED
jgi:Histidine kinase-, DNA gyrase B-, and HSP90-like ATPase